MQRATKQNNLCRSQKQRKLVFNEEGKQMIIPCLRSVSSEIPYEMFKKEMSRRAQPREKSLCCLFLCFPKLYTLLPSPSLSCFLSLLLLSLFGHPPGPSTTTPLQSPPAPCLSQLSSALAAFCGGLPEALLWTDSALRAKIVQ